MVVLDITIPSLPEFAKKSIEAKTTINQHLEWPAAKHGRARTQSNLHVVCIRLIRVGTCSMMNALGLGQVCNFDAEKSSNASLFAFAEFVHATAEDELKRTSAHYFERRGNASLTASWSS